MLAGGVSAKPRFLCLPPDGPRPGRKGAVVWRSDDARTPHSVPSLPPLKGSPQWGVCGQPARTPQRGGYRTPVRAVRQNSTDSAGGCGSFIAGCVNKIPVRSPSTFDRHVVPVPPSQPNPPGTVRVPSAAGAAIQNPQPPRRGTSWPVPVGHR